MTEITCDHGVGPGRPEAVGPEQEPLVEVELTGCPDAVPHLMVARSRLDQGRLKIPFRDGYDHFDFDSYITRNGNQVPVFVWSGRTKIAE